MTRRHGNSSLRLGACAAALVAWSAPRALAQEGVSADLGVGRWRSPTSSIDAPLLGLKGTHAMSRVRLDGALALTAPAGTPGGSPLRLGIVHLRAASDSVTVRGFRGSLDVGLDRDAYDSSFGQARVHATPRLAFGGGGMEAWVSAGPTRALEGGPTSGGMASETGASLTRGRTTLSLSVLERRARQFALSRLDPAAGIPPACRATSDVHVECVRNVASTGFAGQLATVMHDVELMVQGGLVTTTMFATTPLPVQRWSAVRIGAPVRDNLMIVAQVGREPPDVVRNLPMRSTAALGMRLSFPGRIDRPAFAPRPSAPVVDVGAPDANGERILLLHVPAAARQVEVRGDMTSWHSVRLTQRGRGLWELRARIEPGVHHLVMRCDAGPWRPVDGLPQADDDFGDATSVLIVDAARAGG